MAHPSMTTIGVLAMQGDFAEHIAALQAISSKDSPIHAVAVRTPAELEPCQGLILPGGESTTMALLINASGLYDPIKQFVSDAKEGKNGKAVWGSCAGAILLAKEIEGPVAAGWLGLDGMDIRIARNGFGRQLQSFSCPLQLDCLPSTDPPFLATFIRAPLLHSLLEPQPASSSPPVQILARIPQEKVPSAQLAKAATGGHAGVSADSAAVMLRQGGLVASSWHPELNKDDKRVHQWWVRDVLLGQRHKD